MENWNVLDLFIKGVFGLLALLGANAILKDGVNRWWKKSDDREVIHATNQGKVIDAEEKFQDRILKRLEKFEIELKEVQEKLTTQLVMNTKLETENAHLKEREKAQESQIKELKEINQKQSVKIVNLENQIQSFETTMQIQKAQIEDLNMKFNNLQTKRKTDAA